MTKKLKVKLKLFVYLSITMNVWEGKTSAFISSVLDGGVVNTGSCRGKEVTVLTGCGTTQASTVLDAVTKRKITAHFGNRSLVIQAVIILQLPKSLLP